MLTLTVTTSDGTVTDRRPVAQGPRLMLDVASILAAAAPWMPERERLRHGLYVARCGLGRPWVETATGLRFLVEGTAS